MNKFSKEFSKWQEKAGLPLVPFQIGVFFLITYFIHTIIKLFLIKNYEMLWSISEIKESVFAFLYFIIAMFWMKYEKTVYGNCS